MEQKNPHFQYTVREAEHALIDSIAAKFWTNPKTFDERYKYATHAAILDTGEIVGYIATADYVADSGDYGTRYIHFLRVEPAYRRFGIGSALVSAVREKAKADGTAYLTGFVSPNAAAEAFWNSVGFCLLAGVRAQNGGLCHDMVYALAEKAAAVPTVPCEIVAKPELRVLFDTYMSTALGEYWQKQVENLRAVKAVDETGRVMGLILAQPLDNGSPYRSWGVAPYLYLADDAHPGTGESLVVEMARLAAENGAGSLVTLYKYREYGVNWLELGFVPTRPGMLKGTEGEQIVKCGMKIGR